jgi:hypothetical protein
VRRVGRQHGRLPTTLELDRTINNVFARAADRCASSLARTRLTLLVFFFRFFLSIFVSCERCATARFVLFFCVSDVTLIITVFIRPRPPPPPLIDTVDAMQAHASTARCPARCSIRASHSTNSTQIDHLILADGFPYYRRLMAFMLLLLVCRYRRSRSLK